jgi:alkanesulfonate monooxygenase SsuD/methylene tetrahydromethanopterin reductase-like flavin-dependent oxidoreductase (luciferase family)
VTLDHLSGGRAVFGAGLGMPLEEYTGFGEDPDARVRAEKLDEGLAILQGLLAGAPFSFSGRHYTLRDVHFGPRPVQTRIPIWIAGTWPAKPPFRRAVRFDGVIPIGAKAFPSATELAAVRDYVDARRDPARPWDLVAMGFTRDPSDTARVRAARDAGSTWWLESLHDDLAPFEAATARVRQGPPNV